MEKASLIMFAGMSGRVLACLWHGKWLSLTLKLAGNRRRYPTLE